MNILDAIQDDDGVWGVPEPLAHRRIDWWTNILAEYASVFEPPGEAPEWAIIGRMGDQLIIANREALGDAFGLPISRSWGCVT